MDQFQIKCKMMLYDSIDLIHVFCFVSLAIVRRYCSKKSDYREQENQIIRLSIQVYYIFLDLWDILLALPTFNKKIDNCGGPIF